MLRNIKKQYTDYFIIVWSRIVTFFKKLYAQIYNRLIWAKYYTQTFFFKHKWRIIWLSIFSLTLCNLVILPKIDPYFQNLFFDDNAINNLKTILITLGAALIGAAFISFPLIMFSMQINIDRMPHGLFFKLGKDNFVIFLFLIALSSAVIVCFSSSLLYKPYNPSVAISLTFWAVLIIITCILQAYERTLFLVNPARQLDILLKGVRKDLKLWCRRSEIARPLLNTSNSNISNAVSDSYDIEKFSYMKINPFGEQSSRSGIDHALSFAHRYAACEDYPISSHALSVIIEINFLYIQAKGKTFCSSHWLMENPFSHDNIISHTLESLRKSLNIALKRGDETQTLQILNTFSDLVNLYFQIDYTVPRANKTHANLASGYLSEAVKSVRQHNMTDIVMEGLRIMGQCALLYIQKEKITDSTSIIDEIGAITLTGIVDQKQYPIVLVGMQQFTKLTLALLTSQSHDISFASDKLRENSQFIAKWFIKIPQTLLEQKHHTYLAPYYSFHDSNLMSQLEKIANTILEVGKEDTSIIHIIRNFEVWSDKLYIPMRKLYEEAIKQKTGFLSDVIEWIKSISEVLLALTNAPLCNEDCKKKLERNACFLLSSLSFIPEDTDSTTFVTNYSLHERLFECAMTGYKWDCHDYVETAYDCLMSWAFKAGKERRQQTILEKSLYGLIAIVLHSKSQISISDLEYKIQKKLMTNSFSQEILSRIAEDMREQANSLYDLQYSHTLSVIERAMAKVDRNQLKAVLLKIALLLSPNEDLKS